MPSLKGAMPSLSADELASSLGPPSPSTFVASPAIFDRCMNALYAERNAMQKDLKKDLQAGLQAAHETTSLLAHETGRLSDDHDMLRTHVIELAGQANELSAERLHSAKKEVLTEVRELSTTMSADLKTLGTALSHKVGRADAKSAQLGAALGTLESSLEGRIRELEVQYAEALREVHARIDGVANGVLASDEKRTASDARHEAAMGAERLARMASIEAQSVARAEALEAEGRARALAVAAEAHAREEAVEMLAERLQATEARLQATEARLQATEARLQATEARRLASEALQQVHEAHVGRLDEQVRLPSPACMHASHLM